MRGAQKVSDLRTDARDGERLRGVLVAGIEHAHLGEAILGRGKGACGGGGRTRTVTQVIGVTSAFVPRSRINVTSEVINV